MISTLIAVLVLAGLCAAALRYGADSRDGRDWRRQAPGRVPADGGLRHREHSPARDLAVIGRRLRRAGTAFVAFNRAQVDLWERYLLAQRPGQAERLRWVPTRDGWRLAGRIAPHVPAGGGVRIPRQPGPPDDRPQRLTGC